MEQDNLDLNSESETPAEDLLVIKGYIDRYEGGFLYGWVFDPNVPEAPVRVSVLDGQDLLGTVEADKYRPDLEKAGFGNGCHGFQLRVLKPLDNGASHPITLVAAESGAAIQSPEFVVCIRHEWEATIHALRGADLSGDFACTTAAPPLLRYALLVDGEKVGEAVSERDGGTGRYPFQYPIPGEFHDGRPHVLTVALLDYLIGEASYATILRPITTPWQYLATDPQASERLYGGLPSQVARRLAIFQARMAKAVAAEDWAEAQNIQTVMQVLQGGYENRKVYPRLDLPETAAPDASIIIPVHNKFELTYHCLASLIFSENSASYEVIIVDDCSTDKTTEINDIVANVQLIVNEENQGFLRNCNKAAQVARGRYIVLLNNDTEVGNHWLDEMLELFQRFDKVGAVGAKLTYPDGSLQEAGGIVWDNGEPWNLGREGNPFEPQWNYVRQADFLSGAALAVPMTVWEEVGGLSDEFAPAYYEDTDLAFKVRAAGYRTLYCPHAEVVHFEGMSHGRDTASGFKRYQTLNAPKFREKWVEAYASNGRMGEALWRNKDRGVRYRALVIDYATPQPDKDAGSYAAVQEMRLLQAHGFKVSFVPENLSHFGSYTTDLQKMGIECLHAPFYTSMQDLLRKRGHEFDLVFITRYDVADRYIDLVRQFTKAKVLFNNADLHFLRELRGALAKGKADLAGPLATRDRELALMRKVDAILSYNEAEHAVIVSHNLREDNIFKCPWVLPAHGHLTPFEAREGIAFLGGYRHPPNIEAVEFFVEKVMPLLRKQRGDIKFHIYGSHAPKEFERFHGDDIVVEGYVESLDEVFEKCRIFVAPLLSGAGIKGKVLEAMSWGVPSVLSPVAAEATGLSNGISTLIAESPEEWVEAIVGLYEDELKWQSMSDHALDLARRNYSFDNGWKQMGKALAYLGFFSARMDAYAYAK